MVKTCSKCKQDKPAEDFCKNQAWCRECRKEYDKAYRKQNREKCKGYYKAYYQQNREKAKAYYQQNREKIKECAKAYRKQNREKIKEYHKAWYQQNAEKKKEYKKAYYEQNRENVKESQKAYNKQNRDKRRIYARNKLKTDINFKLSNNLRGRVYKVLNGKSKSKNTLKLLGCSVDFLKKHLESQFEPGMSWENYGFDGWHVDHILPCASFDLSDPKQQQKCFHYSNLQPLWAEDNMRKGAKLN